MADLLRNFSKALTWLYKGIGLDQPATLTTLDTRALQPVIDAFQGGWSVGVYRLQKEVEVGAGGVFEDSLSNFAANADLCRVVLGISVRNIDVAAGMTLNIHKTRVSGDALHMGSTGALAAAARTTWSVIGAGAPYWVYEPGTTLGYITAAAVAGGQTFEILVSWVEMPAGFKPI